MKIIFLDFDGVLNDTVSITRVPFMRGRKWNHDSLRIHLVERLNKIVQQTGAKVVVSSSWRVVFSVEDLQAILDDAGFVGTVIGTTKVLNENNTFRDGDGVKFYDRYDEIIRWVWMYDNDGRGEVDPLTHYVTIDDVAQNFDNAYGNDFANHLVLTNPDLGLQDTDVDKAVEILTLRTRKL